MLGSRVFAHPGLSEAMHISSNVLAEQFVNPGALLGHGDGAPLACARAVSPQLQRTASCLTCCGGGRTNEPPPGCSGSPQPQQGLSTAAMSPTWSAGRASGRGGSTSTWLTKAGSVEFDPARPSPNMRNPARPAPSARVSVTLLHHPLPSAGASLVVERERPQNGRTLVNG